MTDAGAACTGRGEGPEKGSGPIFCNLRKWGTLPPSFVSVAWNTSPNPPEPRWFVILTSKTSDIGFPDSIRA